MDGHRFDDLTRALAAGASRRTLIRGWASGFAGLLGVAGASRVAAGDDDDDDDCRRLGGRCQRDGHCCRGTVCEGGRCRLGCRIEGVFYAVGAARPGSPCQVCFPPTGTTRWTNRINGATCDDGNPCTGSGSCRSGACVAGPDTVTPTCAPLDRCHVAGVCDPATGGCTTPNAPNGTGCDDGDPCSTNDTCQDGSCRAGTAVDCSGLTGGCVEGFCATDGTCATRPANEGVACGDPVGDLCNPTVCQAGVCAPKAVVCESGECETAFCLGGTCQTVSAPNGVQCGESTECSVGQCFGGSCRQVRANDGSACGEPLNEECRSRVCRDGGCVIENAMLGSSCARGACFQGTCCVGGTTGSDACNPNLNGGVCCADPKTCCGGGCCPDAQCQVGDTSQFDPPLFCCGDRTTTICGNQCCASGSESPECVTFNGQQICGKAERICKTETGGDEICNDKCCVVDGVPRCCPPNTVCTPGGCRRLDVVCTTDAQCVTAGFGQFGRCAGVLVNIVPEIGPVPVPGSGRCCDSSRVGNAGSTNPDGSPITICCASGSAPCASNGFCVAYPNYTCTGCQCSFRITRPR